MSAIALEHILCIIAIALTLVVAMMARTTVLLWIGREIRVIWVSRVCGGGIVMIVMMESRSMLVVMGIWIVGRGDWRTIVATMWGRIMWTPVRVMVEGCAY